MHRPPSRPSHPRQAGNGKDCGGPRKVDHGLRWSFEEQPVSFSELCVLGVFVVITNVNQDEFYFYLARHVKPIARMQNTPVNPGEFTRLGLPEMNRPW